MFSQLPLDTQSAHALGSLFDPLPHSQRMHCLVEMTDHEPKHSGYIVKMEFCNQYVPILEATRRPRNANKFLTSGFFIQPAFNSPSSALTGGANSAATTTDKASPFEPTPLGQKVTPAARAEPHSPAPPPLAAAVAAPTRSLLKQLYSTLRGGHGQSITDAAQDEPVWNVPTSSSCHRRRQPVRPILAEVSGRTITNRYQFCSSAQRFEEGSLGTLSIFSSYVRFKPRQISLTLQTPGDTDPPLTLESKRPEWNEGHQIYELDFGGRVKRDSVKNFQIEKKGQVVSIAIIIAIVLYNILIKRKFICYSVQVHYEMLDEYIQYMQTCYISYLHVGPSVWQGRLDALLPGLSSSLLPNPGALCCFSMHSMIILLRTIIIISTVYIYRQSIYIIYT